jgi:hypothetical protein
MHGGLHVGGEPGARVSPHHRGAGGKSALRETLEDFAYFLEQAHRNLSHITEFVGTDLPHIYGYTDACRTGMGGVILPATRWIQPSVWRTKFPDDIVTLFDTGTYRSMTWSLQQTSRPKEWRSTCCKGRSRASTLGSVPTTPQPCPGRPRRLPGPRRGHISPHKCCEPKPCSNTTPVAVPRTPHTLKAQQIYSVRSFDAGWQANPGGDAAFLREFSHHHPLPLQLGHWQLAPLPIAISSVVCSMLRGSLIKCNHTKTGIGNIGQSLPSSLDSILSCHTPKGQPTTWNAHCCSWPLLSPCGKVTSTTVKLLEEQRSRGRYASVHNSWSHMDFATLQSRSV